MPSLTLPACLKAKFSNRRIPLTALVDSGAEGLIISKNFAQKHRLTLHRLKNAFPVLNIDGTPNQARLVEYSTMQQLEINIGGKLHLETIELYVTDIGTHDLVLGTSTLR